MIDWNSLLYDPLFSTLGVPATLEVNASTYDVTVIDQTAGIEVDGGGLNAHSIKPVAEIRMAELADNSIDPTGLKDATLTFSGNAWTVKNTAPQPGPDGKGTGVLQLILVNGDL